MGIPRFSLVRTGLAARRDWLEAMNLIAGSGAPVQRAGIGMPVLVVQDPEAARQVLVGDAASYERPWIVKNIMSEGLSHTLFTSEGHEWLTRRQRVAPVFGRAQPAPCRPSRRRRSLRCRHRRRVHRLPVRRP